MLSNRKGDRAIVSVLTPEVGVIDKLVTVQSEEGQS